MPTATTPNVEYINPFVRATMDALSTMAELEIEKTNLTVKSGEGASYDISGIIGLAGEVCGSVVLSFPRATAYKIVSKFLGERKLTLDDDVQDAIGELTNIVAGGAKRDLSQLGYGFKIGLPSVVVGPGHTVVRPKNAPTICVHFGSAEGEFVVEVCLKRADGSSMEGRP